MAKRVGKIPSGAAYKADDVQLSSMDSLPFRWEEDEAGRPYIRTDMGHAFYQMDEKGRVHTPNVKQFDKDTEPYLGDGQVFTLMDKEACEYHYLLNVRPVEKAYMAGLANGIFDPRFGQELSPGDYEKCQCVKLQPEYAGKYGQNDIAVAREQFSKFLGLQRGSVPMETSLIKGDMVKAAMAMSEAVYPNPSEPELSTVAAKVREHGGEFKAYYGKNDGNYMRIPAGAYIILEKGRMSGRMGEIPGAEHVHSAQTADDYVLSKLKALSKDGGKAYHTYNSETAARDPIINPDGPYAARAQSRANHPSGYFKMDEERAAIIKALDEAEPHWDDFDDGSGSLQTKFGHSFYSYDLATNEIQFPSDRGHYREVEGSWREDAMTDYALHVYPKEKEYAAALVKGVYKPLFYEPIDRYTFGREYEAAPWVEIVPGKMGLVMARGDFEAVRKEMNNALRERDIHMGIRDCATAIKNSIRTEGEFGFRCQVYGVNIPGEKFRKLRSGYEVGEPMMPGARDAAPDAMEWKGMDTPW